SSCVRRQLSTPEAGFSTPALDCSTAPRDHRYAEDELHGTPGDYITGDLIGYTTGLLITLVLLVLTLRAAKLPGTPTANIIFAVCGLLWSAGGLVRAACLGSGMAQLRGVASMALSVQYTGAAAFPIA